MAGKDERAAKKYAKALFDAVEPDSLESVREAVNALAGAWQESTELRAALLNPATAVKERIAVAQDMAGIAAAGNESLKNFASILAENGRLNILPSIAENFSDLIDRLKEVSRLEIISAFPMSDEEKEKVLSEVRKSAGSLAAVEWSVDAELLGGRVIKSGDKLLDASLSGSLDKAKQALMV